MTVNFAAAPDSMLKADVRLEPLLGRAGGPMGVFPPPLATTRVREASR
ncbi:MAG: hypothetical protein L0271_12530 [Gemmatimonadetes bacterium]|nr:hypothetical protein [Gemmatimonadota bacterium]